MELLTSQHSRSAIFLDLDGVINEMVYNPEFGLVDSPANTKEFILLPSVGNAIRKLNQMGLLVIVVSNQPGVAKGRYSLALHNAMTEKMHLELTQAGAKLDAFYYCLYHPEA
jgi:D-glycero-D-manno-heptose 1,7-bisphosphate phosphatase